MRIIVTDTSCIIDLQKAALLFEALRLPHTFVTVNTLFEDEWLSFSADEKIELRKRGLDLKELPGSSVLRAAKPFMCIPGQHDVFGDGSVLLFPPPGHTPGHQSARIRTATGDVILTSDCCNLRRSVNELRLPDHCRDADQYLATLKALAQMRAQGVRICYGHDPEFWARIPQGIPIG